MTSKISASKRHKAFVILFLLTFTLVAGFSGYFHNHTPGEHSSDCPVYLIHLFFNTEVAGSFILVLFFSALFFTAAPMDLFLPNRASLPFLNRAPPVTSS